MTPAMLADKIARLHSRLAGDPSRWYAEAGEAIREYEATRLAVFPASAANEIEAGVLRDERPVAPGQPCDRCGRPRAKPDAADDDFLCFAFEGAGHMAVSDCAEFELENLREEVPALRTEAKTASESISALCNEVELVRAFWLQAQAERDSYKADAESAAETIAALRRELEFGRRGRLQAEAELEAMAESVRELVAVIDRDGGQKQGGETLPASVDRAKAAVVERHCAIGGLVLQVAELSRCAVDAEMQLEKADAALEWLATTDAGQGTDFALTCIFPGGHGDGAVSHDGSGADVRRALLQVHCEHDARTKGGN